MQSAQMLRLFLTLPIFLAGCLKDETISGFVDPKATYQLTEINGAAFTARAEISFPAKGSVLGKAPCNSFSAEQTAPYPWFEIGSMTVTRAACAQMEAEAEFFKAFGSMSLIEASGNVVILRNDDGDEMVFKTTQE